MNYDGKIAYWLIFKSLRIVTNVDFSFGWNEAKRKMLCLQWKKSVKDNEIEWDGGEDDSTKIQGKGKSLQRVFLNVH